MIYKAIVFRSYYYTKDEIKSKRFLNEKYEDACKRIAQEEFINDLNNGLINNPYDDISVIIKKVDNIH